MNATDRIRGFLAGLKRLSTVWIVAANLAPMICVVLFGWPAGVLLMLYWCENVIIGGFNVLKMAASGAANGRAGLVVGGFTIPFFIFHYGMFCFVHGMFVVLVGSLGTRTMPDVPGMFSLVGHVEGLIRHEKGFAWSLLSIVGLHLFSFVFDWLAKGKYRLTNPMLQMFEPYGRIVVLHITLMAGTVAVLVLGNPIWALVALAVMKTLFDLGMAAKIGFDPEAVAKSNQAMEELRAKMAGKKT